MSPKRTGPSDREKRLRDLWWQGKTIPEISAETGMTPNNVGVTLAKMRRHGIPLPYRRKAYADVPFGSGTWDERRAEMKKRRGSQRTTIHKSAYVRMLKADPCAYCGGRGGTLDHVTAWVAGGSDDMENLIGACGRCNTSRSDDSPLFFMLRRRILAELALTRPPGWKGGRLGRL